MSDIGLELHFSECLTFPEKGFHHHHHHVHEGLGVFPVP
jgi:hypothetical protein